MTQTDRLVTDCSKCAALCCLVLSFDRGKGFAFSKNQGEPCRNLSGHSCSIHADLKRKGFPGCVAYDCLGAGNRVVQEVFGGQSWRTEPRLSRLMMEAFSAMTEMHKRIDLLRAAGTCDLAPAHEEMRLDLLRQLEDHQWTADELHDFEVGLALEVDIFVHTIRPNLPDSFFEED